MSRVVKFKVQHYIDIATSAESMQIINFSIGGKDLMTRCGHLIGAYRFFKLGSIGVKFVPASTLPVDPLGLSYADGDEQTVDPRDQLDCGLVRITNGEDLRTDISGFTAEQQKNLYDAMLLDPRWYKFGLQSGFKRVAKPLFYQVGQFHQDIFPGATSNVPITQNDNPQFGEHQVNTFSEFAINIASGSGSANSWRSRYIQPNSDPRGFFQTGNRGRLGWMRTDAFQQIATPDAIIDKEMFYPFPEIRTITCVLPKMRKTNYFYRIYITETVYFSGVRTFGPIIGDSAAGWPEISTGIDNFAYGQAHLITPTTVAVTPIMGNGVKKPNSGGDE